MLHFGRDAWYLSFDEFWTAIKGKLYDGLNSMEVYEDQAFQIIFLLQWIKHHLEAVGYTTNTEPPANSSAVVPSVVHPRTLRPIVAQMLELQDISLLHTAAADTNVLVLSAPSGISVTDVLARLRTSNSNARQGVIDLFVSLACHMVTQQYRNPEYQAAKRCVSWLQTRLREAIIDGNARL
jgi:hypothetical protein